MNDFGPWTFKDLYRNGRTFRSDRPTPPDPYPTVTDFHVLPSTTAEFGVGMVWVSDRLGLLTTFPWWDNLESDERLVDPDWRPVGTVQRPFGDVEQGWSVSIWNDRDLVYVHQGDELGTIHTWYRVPLPTFEAAWKQGIRAIRDTVPPPRPEPQQKRKRKRAMARP